MIAFEANIYESDVVMRPTLNLLNPAPSLVPYRSTERRADIFIWYLLFAFREMCEVLWNIADLDSPQLFYFE